MSTYLSPQTSAPWGQLRVQKPLKGLQSGQGTGDLAGTTNRSIAIVLMLFTRVYGGQFQFSFHP